MDTANRQTLNIFFGFLESFVKKGEKQEEWSFTRWAEQQGMQGHALRKAKTIARALELATHDIGPAYLVSRPAEVQLRRLIALALSVNAGWRVAGHLEELPGDSIISALPASPVKKLSRRTSTSARAVRRGCAPTIRRWCRRWSAVSPPL